MLQLGKHQWKRRERGPFIIGQSTVEEFMNASVVFKISRCSHLPPYSTPPLFPTLLQRVTLYIKAHSHYLYLNLLTPLYLHLAMESFQASPFFFLPRPRTTEPYASLRSLTSGLDIPDSRICL